MLIMLMMTTFTLILSSLIMILASVISKKTFMDQEKNSPFECGFNPKQSSRNPFSIHFFLIALIFLIFDVEISILIPFIMIMKSINLINYMMIFNYFIIILLLGLFHEWNQGMLKWSY